MRLDSAFRLAIRLKLEDLLNYKAFTPEMVMLLEGAIKARLNIIISGGTGSGKTTLLNTLSSFIPNDQRIVTIEDAAELQLQQDHVVRLETRPPNIEGKGAITATDLVKNALRMRPERVIIGECRGAETLDMLQAMNTGHEGSMTTLHANTPRDAVARIETMITMSGFELPLKAMRQQIASAVDLIVQANRLQGGPRKITHITEVVRHGAGHDRDARHLPLRARRNQRSGPGVRPFRGDRHAADVHGSPGIRRRAVAGQRLPAAASCWSTETNPQPPTRRENHALPMISSSSFAGNNMSPLLDSQSPCSWPLPPCRRGGNLCAASRKRRSKTAWPCSPAAKIAGGGKDNLLKDSGVLSQPLDATQGILAAFLGRFRNLSLLVRAGRYDDHARRDSSRICGVLASWAA